jgi:asparagine synthase (glutamine-hydrolysing)
LDLRVNELKAMVNSMVHESFYTSGMLANAVQGLHCGWTSFRGAFADCMPVWNEEKNVCLIFSGEHFADKEGMASLKAKGHDFRGNDASWLVHLYEELGPAFFGTLNGWFSGVLLDLRKKTVTLFNDRYGVNRIYFCETQDGFYFASEAKALLKVLPETRQLDNQGVGEYFSCGCVLQERTLFRGVRLLPPASAWVFSLGQPARKEQYFRAEEWANLPQLTPREFYDSLKSVWAKRLPHYLNGNEPVALSMTGGVDSRMILACARTEPGKFPCYTFGGMYRECADVKLSRVVAQACKQPHETIALNPAFFTEFPALAAKAVYITDGSLDVTGATDLYVHRRVREIAPVRVSGLNGGEILRRLVMFKPRTGMWENILAPEMMRHVEATAETYAGELNGHRLSFAAFKQTPWHMHARLAIERSQITIRTPYMDNELVALAYRTPPECLENSVSLRIIAEGEPSLAGIGTDRGLALKSVPVLGKLGHFWQEFTFKAEYAYDYGMPQWLAKVDHALQPFHLERIYLGRHKWHHFRIWYKNELSRFLKDMLLDSAALRRPYMSPSRLQGVILDHIRGSRNYTVEIHRLLTCEFIQRQLVGAD